MDSSGTAPNPEASVPWDAASYNEVSKPQQEWGIELMDAFDWRGDETVLDAGCGSGLLTLELLKRIPRGRVLAVDSDPGMIDQAKANLSAELDSGRVELHHADLLRFRASPPAEVIFSNAVFHWIKDHEALWKACFESLVPGGRLLVQFGGAENLAPQMALFDEVAARLPYRPLLAGFDRGWNRTSAATARLGLAKAGFFDIEARELSKQPRFESAESFGRYLRTVILRPYRKRLGECLWNALAEEYTALHFARLGPELAYRRLEIRARRPRP